MYSPFKLFHPRPSEIITAPIPMLWICYTRSLIKIICHQKQIHCAGVQAKNLAQEACGEQTITKKIFQQYTFRHGLKISRVSDLSLKNALDWIWETKRPLLKVPWLIPHRHIPHRHIPHRHIPHQHNPYQNDPTPTISHTKINPYQPLTHTKINPHQHYPTQKL